MGGPVKAFWSLLGGSPELVEGLLGASWNPFGISWQLLGGVLGSFSMRLGASWGLIGGLSSPSEAKRQEGKIDRFPTSLKMFGFSEVSWRVSRSPLGLS